MKKILLVILFMLACTGVNTEYMDDVEDLATPSADMALFKLPSPTPLSPCGPNNVVDTYEPGLRGPWENIHTDTVLKTRCSWTTVKDSDGCYRCLPDNVIGFQIPSGPFPEKADTCNISSLPSQYINLVVASRTTAMIDKNTMRVPVIMNRYFTYGSVATGKTAVGGTSFTFVCLSSLKELSLKDLSSKP